MSLSWLYCDNSYIASSASDVSALLVCTALHPQITHTHTHFIKFSVTPMSIWMSQNSSTVSPSVVSQFWSTQTHWQVARQVQLHCLSKLNLLIPCVCTITYPVFISNLHGRQQVALVNLDVQSMEVVNHAGEQVNILEYTEHFRVYTDLGKQGATNAGE